MKGSRDMTSVMLVWAGDSCRWVFDYGGCTRLWPLKAARDSTAAHPWSGSQSYFSDLEWNSSAVLMCFFHRHRHIRMRGGPPVVSRCACSIASSHWLHSAYHLISCSVLFRKSLQYMLQFRDKVMAVNQVDVQFTLMYSDISGKCICWLNLKLDGILDARTWCMSWQPAGEQIVNCHIFLFNLNNNLKVSGILKCHLSERSPAALCVFVRCSDYSFPPLRRCSGQISSSRYI